MIQVRYELPKTTSHCRGLRQYAQNTHVSEAASASRALISRSGMAQMAESTGPRRRQIGGYRSQSDGQRKLRL
jgi:hypothetical protein